MKPFHILLPCFLIMPVVTPNREAVDPSTTEKSLPVILNSGYNLDSATGSRLEVYATRSFRETPRTCALECSVRRGWWPPCLAFVYHSSKGACHFYTRSNTQISDAGLQVFRFELWDRFHAVMVGDRQYSIFISSDLKNYLDARRLCREMGGHLLVFDTLDKYQVVQAVVSQWEVGKAFVGGNDLDVEGRWVTEKDGAPPINPATWIWKDGEPEVEDDENCAVVSVEHLVIGPMDCDLSTNFLCERD